MKHGTNKAIVQLGSLDTTPILNKTGRRSYSQGEDGNLTFAFGAVATIGGTHVEVL